MHVATCHARDHPCSTQQHSHHAPVKHDASNSTMSGLSSRPTSSRSCCDWYTSPSAPSTSQICSSLRLYATNSLAVGMSTPYTLGYRTGGDADARYTFVEACSHTCWSYDVVKDPIQRQLRTTYLFGASLAHHIDNLRHRGPAHDGVVHQQHRLAGKHRRHGVELALDAQLARALICAWAVFCNICLDNKRSMCCVTHVLFYSCS